jgi:hypothetical protein
MVRTDKSPYSPYMYIRVIPVIYLNHYKRDDSYAKLE